MLRRALLFACLITAAAVGTSSARSEPARSAPGAYVIGADDVLQIVFWKDKDLSADVVVRPDGAISLPLLNDVQAAGLTPDHLREVIAKAASRFVDSPSVTIVVKQINSRRVFITGQIDKPGSYALNAPMTILQLIATAGGLKEDADADHILLMPPGGGGEPRQFNYRDVVKRKRNADNLALNPGDTVIVP